MDSNLENPKENAQEPTEQKPDTASLEARIKQLESENGKLKQSVTNASADASDWKRKYQSKLSEEEKAKEEHDSAYAAMQEKIATLEARERIANYTAALTESGIGMDADTAKSVAEAMNSGEADKVFDGIRKFIATHDRLLKENAFRTNPTLPGGAVPKAITKEQFDKMGYKERVKVFDEHPDLYKEFTS